MTFTDAFSIINNLDSGYLNINFVTEKGKIVDNVKCYLYDENNKLVQNFDGYSNSYLYELPTGKYFIELYDIPSGYFIEKNKLQIKIDKDTQLNYDVVFESIYDLN